MAKRGIRNNNPGNVRKTKDKWNGLAAEQTDPDYFVFTAPRYGIRTMGKLLLKYQHDYGLNTVTELINRWAPPVENNTNSYADHVADRLGVDPHEPISVTDRLEELVSVIIKHENGVQPYDSEVIMEGCSMARA